eukprot:GHVS01015461.1.p1 GENE.GHVS01015461.1~~GHVS01015461.1.p1  ORF type:complete len:529 (+),score=119.71 GHVS01015461.1:228-1814(+)
MRSSPTSSPSARRTLTRSFLVSLPSAVTKTSSFSPRAGPPSPLSFLLPSFLASHRPTESFSPQTTRLAPAPYTCPTVSVSAPATCISASTVPSCTAIAKLPSCTTTATVPSCTTAIAKVPSSSCTTATTAATVPCSTTTTRVPSCTISPSSLVSPLHPSPLSTFPPKPVTLSTASPATLNRSASGASRSVHSRCLPGPPPSGIAPSAGSRGEDPSAASDAAGVVQEVLRSLSLVFSGMRFDCGGRRKGWSEVEEEDEGEGKQRQDLLLHMELLFGRLGGRQEEIDDLKQKMQQVDNCLIDDSTYVFPPLLESVKTAEELVPELLKRLPSMFSAVELYRYFRLPQTCHPLHLPSLEAALLQEAVPALLEAKRTELQALLDVKGRELSALLTQIHVLRKALRSRYLKVMGDRLNSEQLGNVDMDVAELEAIVRTRDKAFTTAVFELVQNSSDNDKPTWPIFEEHLNGCVLRRARQNVLLSSPLKQGEAGALFVHREAREEQQAGALFVHREAREELADEGDEELVTRPCG